MYIYLHFSKAKYNPLVHLLAELVVEEEKERNFLKLDISLYSGSEENEHIRTLLSNTRQPAMGMASGSLAGSSVVWLGAAHHFNEIPIQNFAFK